MALEKESLINFLPDGFETLNQEGYKENFSADKIATGYEKDVKDRVTGPNLNNLIDVIGKNTNTLNNYVEYLNNMPISSVPYVNANNQLDYQDIGQLRNKADKNLANTGMITNCLLEIPQRIKLELVDGAAILKAGSEVIVPNGENTFDYVTIESDLTCPNGGTGSNTDAILCYNATSKTLTYGSASSVTSGTTAPTGSGYFYDTNNNVIKYYSSGAPQGYIYSFPIALVTRENGAFTTVKNLFNGIGYIGSTTWVDKGVKGLIPNGRNEDGTLVNVEYELNNLLLRDVGGNSTSPLYKLIFNLDEKRLISVRSLGNYKNLPSTVDDIYSWVIYNETDNLYYFTNGSITANWEKCLITDIADVQVDVNGTVTNLNPKQPFRAVDYNEFNSTYNEFNSTPHIIEHYTNGSSWYYVLSNGWCEQGGLAQITGKSTTVTLLKKFTTTNYGVLSNVNTTASSGYDVFYNVMILARTSTAFSINTNTTASGVPFSWRAYGKIKEN